MKTWLRAYFVLFVVVAAAVPLILPAGMQSLMLPLIVIIGVIMLLIPLVLRLVGQHSLPSGGNLPAAAASGRHAGATSVPAASGAERDGDDWWEKQRINDLRAGELVAQERREERQQRLQEERDAAEWAESVREARQQREEEEICRAEVERQKWDDVREEQNRRWAGDE